MFTPFGGPCFTFRGHFLYVNEVFSTYAEKFLGVFPLTKISAGAHALDARVVVNYYDALGKLREIERNCET